MLIFSSSLEGVLKKFNILLGIEDATTTDAMGQLKLSMDELEYPLECRCQPRTQSPLTAGIRRVLAGFTAGQPDSTNLAKQGGI